jgi:hypothetical protein
VEDAETFLTRIMRGMAADLAQSDYKESALRLVRFTGPEIAAVINQSLTKIAPVLS